MNILFDMKSLQHKPSRELAKKKTLPKPIRNTLKFYNLSFNSDIS